MQDRSQSELFRNIWNSRSRVSFVSGKPLGDIAMSTFFAHVLPKGKYTKFKLEEKNIVLLTFEEHHLWDMGTEHQRKMYAQRANADWGKLERLRDKLRVEYNAL